MRFAYPDSFLVGRFANIFGDISSRSPSIAGEAALPLQNAVVLVRPEDLGSYPLDTIPVGEIPVIWFDKPFGAKAAPRLLPRPDTSYALGALNVVEYPGFPGPYGEEAFYYVVEFQDGTLLEVAAHRRQVGISDAATHFDEIIKEILPTLEQVGK